VESAREERQHRTTVEERDIPKLRTKRAVGTGDEKVAAGDSIDEVVVAVEKLVLLLVGAKPVDTWLLRLLLVQSLHHRDDEANAGVVGEALLLALRVKSRTLRLLVFRWKKPVK